MPDLYSTLGVKKNASRAEIRGAYRKAAKKAHPDSGGDADKFAMISLAADVLSDDERRAKYDATGSVEDKPQEKSMSVVLEAIDAVLNECVRRGIAPESVDVIADSKKTLKIKLEKMDEQYKAGLAQLVSARKIAKRFKTKKGKPNRISALLEGRIRQAEEATQASIRDRPSIERALEILSDHEYDWTARDNSSGTTMDMQFIMRNAFGP